MSLSTPATRQWVETIALSRYPYDSQDEHGFETDQERVFGLLVAVAATYTDIIAEESAARFAVALDGGPDVTSMGDLLPGPADVTVTGLAENLDMITDGSWPAV